VVLVAVLQAQEESVRAADSVAIMPTSCITASGPHALVLAAVLDSCWQVRRTSWRAEAEAVFFARPSVVYAVSEAFALSLSAVPNYGLTPQGND
jgi:hypothetical protein